MAGLALWSGFRILHRCMLSLMKLHSCADFREGEQHPFYVCVGVCVQEQQLLHSSSHLFQCWGRDLTPLPQARRRSRTFVGGTRSRSSVYKRWPRREGAAAARTPSPKTRDPREHRNFAATAAAAAAHIPDRKRYVRPLLLFRSFHKSSGARGPKTKKFCSAGEVPGRWCCVKAL